MCQPFFFSSRGQQGREEISASMAQMLLFVLADYQASVPRTSSCGLQRCIRASCLVLMDVWKTNSCGCCSSLLLSVGRAQARTSNHTTAFSSHRIQGLSVRYGNRREQELYRPKKEKERLHELCRLTENNNNNNADVVVASLAFSSSSSEEKYQPSLFLSLFLANDESFNNRRYSIVYC